MRILDEVKYAPHMLCSPFFLLSYRRTSGHISIYSKFSTLPPSAPVCVYGLSLRVQLPQLDTQLSLTNGVDKIVYGSSPPGPQRRPRLAPPRRQSPPSASSPRPCRRFSPARNPRGDADGSATEAPAAARPPDHCRRPSLETRQVSPSVIIK